MPKYDDVKEDVKADTLPVEPKKTECPVFVLKACDKLALIAVDAWLAVAREAEVSAQKIALATDAKLKMIDWQKENSDNIKLPD